MDFKTKMGQVFATENTEKEEILKALLDDSVISVARI
jgi:hypothetical protein